MQERRDPQDRRDTSERQENPVNLALEDLGEKSAIKDLQELQERMALMDRKVNQEVLDLSEPLVYPDDLGHQDSVVPREPRETLERLELRARKETEVATAKTVNLVYLA